MDNGLKMTRIYQVSKYQPETYFKQFANKVSQARQDRDRDAACAIKSETMKLFGNVAYGKTLTNEAKHVNVDYVLSDKTSNIIINPRF